MSVSPQSEKDEAQREERHAAYDLARSSTGLFSAGLLRRASTWDRDIRSWPLFFGASALVALAYLLLGRGHWDFRDPISGELDAALIAVFLLVCVSFTYLVWPAPAKRSD